MNRISPRWRGTARAAILYALPFVVWMFFWITFFPGLMNADSIHSWADVALGQYDESQTGFMPILYSWLTRLWFSPAILSLAQVAFMMAVLFKVYAVLRRIGAPSWLLAGVAVYFVFQPFVDTSLITIIKDTPAGILQLLLLLFSIEIVESGGESLKGLKNLAALAVTLASMCLVRDEGWLSVATFLACLVVLYPPRWRQVGGITVASVALVGIVQGPLFSAYHVAKNASIETVIMECSEIAIVYNNRGVVAPSEAAFIDKIAPTASWKVGYDPYTLNNVIFFNPRFNLAFAAEHQAQLRDVWRSVAARNWEILLRSRGPLSAIAWSIPEPAGSFTYAVHLQAVSAGIDPNPFGLHLTHPLPQIEGWLRALVAETSRPQWTWFIYRPALYLYVILGCAGILVYTRRSADAMLLVLPLAPRVAIIALFALSPDSRFFFYAFLMAPVMVAYATTVRLRLRTRDTAERSGRART